MEKENKGSKLLEDFFNYIEQENRISRFLDDASFCLDKAKLLLDYHEIIKRLITIGEYEKTYKKACDRYRQEIGEDEIYKSITTRELKNNIKHQLDTESYTNIRNLLSNEFKNTEISDKEYRIDCLLNIIIETFKENIRFAKQLVEIENNSILIKLKNEILEMEKNSMIERTEGLTTKTYHENKEDINKLKEEFKKELKKEIESGKIDRDTAKIGYLLSEIYEDNQMFSESMEIVKKIKNIYKQICEEELTKDNLRKWIGCLYTYAITDVKDDERTMELVEKEFVDIKVKIDEFTRNRDKCSKDDEYFINAFYESDYGAFLLSKAKFYRSNGQVSKSKEIFEDAKKVHKSALDNRIELRKRIEKNNGDTIEINKMIGKSYRNVATAEFHLSNWKESIKNNELAITEFENIEDKPQLYQTYDCITGSYVAEFKEISISSENYEHFDDCCRKIHKITVYYDKQHNRYKNAIERIDKLEEIIEEIKDDKTKNGAKAVINFIRKS